MGTPSTRPWISNFWYHFFQLFWPSSLVIAVQFYPAFESNFFLLGVFVFVLITCALGLFVWWCLQVILAIAERKRERPFLTTLLFVPLALLCIGFFPRGFFHVETSIPHGAKWLTAYLEGAANCTETIYLLKDGHFVERTVCFGFSENFGTYSIKSDTVFFTYDYIASGEAGDLEYGLFQAEQNGDQMVYSTLKIHKRKHPYPYLPYVISQMDPLYGYWSLPKPVDSLAVNEWSKIN
jgi:hypothetical protein